MSTKWYKALTVSLSILMCSSMILPANSAEAANAAKTPILYNNPGKVWWDTSDVYKFLSLHDFNNDGVLDVRLGGQKFLNSGTNFEPVLPPYEKGVSLNLPKNGEGKLIDFDADGDLDFIYKSEMRLYINSGTDTNPVWSDRGKLKANGSDIINDFTSYYWWDNSNSPSYALADWDDDGVKDLVVAVCDRLLNTDGNTSQFDVYSKGYVYFYKNSGSNESPVFNAGQKLQQNGQDLNLPYKADIDIVDYDNDGVLEILAVTYDGKVRVIEKKSSAIDCEPAVLFRLGEIILYLKAIDLDQDHDLDLVLNTTSSLVTYRKNADGTYSFAGRAKIADGTNVSLRAELFMAPNVVDWEGDGDLDLVTGSENGYIVLFENYGNNKDKKFKDAVRIEAGGRPIDFDAVSGTYRWGGDSVEGYTNPVVVDWDADGDLDIITQDAELATLWYFQNTGTRGRPSYAAGVPFTIGGQQFTMRWRTRPGVMDWDQDGTLDIALVDEKEKIKVYSRTGNNDTKLKLLDTAKNYIGDDIFVQTNAIEIGFVQVQAVDWNRDGLFDLIIGAGNTGRPTSSYDRLNYYRNIGTIGNPKFIQSYMKNADGTDYISLSSHEPMFWIADWNDDGKLDIIDVHVDPHHWDAHAAIFFTDGKGLSVPETLQTYGPNIAPFALLTVDSETRPYEKVRAVDGNVSSNVYRWMSTNEEPNHTFEMEWAREKVPTRVKIWSGLPLGTGTGVQLDDFTIDYWNGSSWITAHTVTDNTYDAALGLYNDIPLDGIRTKKLRLNITDPSHKNDNYARLLEIEVYDNNLAAQAKITVDSSEPNYPGIRAVDRLKDHDSSRWLSGKAESTHYYQMDWSSEQTLNNVKVWSGNTPGGVKGAQIDDYTIEYWNGTSWVIAATVVNNSKDGASGRYNDLYFSPVTTSKLRMNITGPSRIDHTARLIEIEVYGDSNPPSDYHDDDEDGNDKGNQR